MAVQSWVFTISRQNWNIMKEDSVWATNYKNVTRKVNASDRLVFYVAGLKLFRGVFEIEGEFRKTTKPRWSEELNDGRVKYPYEVDVRQIQSGNVPLEAVVERLSFIKNKTHAGVYFQRNPGNFGKPIDRSDFDLIVREMKSHPDTGGMKVSEVVEIVKEPKKAGVDHDTVINTLTTIGDIFGSQELLRKPEVNELRPANRPFKAKVKHLDLAWKFGMSWVPFEVQVHGSVPDLIYRMNLVHQWSHRLVVLAEEEVHEEIKEAAQDYPFADKLVLLTFDDLADALNNLDAMREFRHKILGPE